MYFPTVEKQLLKIMRVADVTIYNADETGWFFRLPANMAWSFKGDPCNGRKNCKERITVLFVCNANWTD